MKTKNRNMFTSLLLIGGLTSYAFGQGNSNNNNAGNNGIPFASVNGQGQPGQVAFWKTTDSITGSNQLFWDDVNSRLGVATSTPGSRFEVQNGNVLFEGASSIFDPNINLPAASTRARVLWIPKRVAFRAGIFHTVPWSESAIGAYSVAMGNNPSAEGDNSIAFGQNATSLSTGGIAVGTNARAESNVCQAFGTGAIAGQQWSTSIGSFNEANGQASWAGGIGSKANFNYSLALGAFVEANNFNSFAIGSGDISSQTPFENTRPRSLAIGFATSVPTLFVGKNGAFDRVGVNTDLPGSELDVNGQITIQGGNPDAGKVLTALNTDGLATWSAVPHDGDWLGAGTGYLHPTAVTDNVRIGTTDPTFFPGPSGTTNEKLVVVNEGIGTDNVGISSYVKADGALSNNRGILSLLDLSGTAGPNNIGIESVVGGTGSTFTHGISKAIAGCSQNSGVFDNYGVYGQAINATWNYGVYGYAENGAFNYGVYGDVGPGLTPSAERWAGYFNGDVYADNFIMPSDKKLKKEIRNLSDATETLMRLMPKTYTYKTDEFSSMNLSTDLQHGFVVQDVEEVLPELVRSVVQPPRYDEEGKMIAEKVTFKGMNYMAIIPYLVQGFKEQQEEIDFLKNRLEELTGPENTSAEGVQAITLESGAILYQNTPNPFGDVTSIAYYIPGNSTSAQLIFMDEYGRVINEMEIREKGNGRTEVNSADLAAGVYSYSLIINGKVIATRKMVKGK